MYRFVEHPNLPRGKVRLIWIGKPYLDLLRLDTYGIETVTVENRENLELPVASHVDMQVVHLYRNYFLSAPVDNCKVKSHYTSYLNETRCKVSELVKLKCEVFSGSTELEPPYPKCAAYNVLLLGKFAVFNPKCIDKALLHYLLSFEYRPIYVNQGFARCSVCVVQEDAVITADMGIARALQVHGIDVLRIQPGYISLPGYDTGFLGGSAFKLSADTLAFTGHLNEHPDRDNILSFIRNHGVYPAVLSGRAIYDIGSAIPVLEEV